MFPVLASYLNAWELSEASHVTRATFGCPLVGSVPSTPKQSDVLAAAWILLLAESTLKLCALERLSDGDAQSNSLMLVPSARASQGIRNFPHTCW